MDRSFLHLERIDNGDMEFQTMGYLRWYEDLVLIRSWAALEPPWRGNKIGESCIPNGHYMVTDRVSDKFGHHLIIQGVPNRSLILIHSGNYRRDTRGCILPGQQFIDINGDHHMDVTQSRTSLQEILALVKLPTSILVTSEFPLA